MLSQLFPKANFAEHEDNDNVYAIGVAVYEANNVSWYNLQTRVCVELGKTSKYSAVKESSERPFYNADFTFHYIGKLEKMMDMILTITVQEVRGGLHRPRALGSARLDLGAIWSQPGHEIADKWILLTHPSDPTGHIRGYINCEINIMMPGERQRLRRFHEPSGYFIPDTQGGGKLKARYIFRVHRGMNIYNPDIKNFSVFVRVFFAGLSGESSKRKKTQFPYWAEEIVFTELFPPMYNRFRIDVHFGKNEVCTKYLNLSSISDPAVKGFLPTYGPSFLHLYNPPYRFLGSLLVSLETKTVHAFSESEKLLGVKRQKTQDLIEKMFWEYEDFALFGIVYEISMLNKEVSESDLYVSLGFSTSEDRPLSEENWFMSWKSRTISMGGPFFCLPKSKTKQTMFTVDKLPDNRHRLFVGNRLLHIALKLVEDLKKINFQLEHYPEIAKTDLLGSLHTMINDCKQFKSSAVVGPTSLEKERFKTIVAKVNKLIKEMTTIKPEMNVEVIFEKSVQICKDILQLVKDPQESFPQIILSLKNNDKVVAYAQVHPSNVLFSTKQSEKGIFCGVIQSLFLKSLTRRSEEVFGGKMDILLWLGPLKSIGHGIESIPGGFQDMSSEYTFPPSIKYSEVNEFTCRVHLYQGHFLPCDEVTGTCSLYMTIYFDCKSASSTIKELLSPVWMETLVIGNSKIFGNIEDAKKNPPSIVIEVHNKGSSENMLFSRQLVKPHVFLARDKLQPPMYPPKPDWLIIQSNGIDRGEILAMFEIVQDRGGLAEAGDKADVTSIPDYIKLSTVKYKFEILFWGLRRTKSFRLSDLSLPSVTITLGSLEIHSYPLRNLLTFPNFNQPLGIFEVNLPEDWHYAPPVVIRLYDSRAFGTTVFIGSHIVRNLKKFVMKLPPRIEQNENKSSLRRLSDETFVFNEARFATQAKSQYFGEIGVFEPEFRKPLIEMKEDVKSKTPLMNKVENRRSRWWNWLCWCFRKKKEDPGYISIGLVSPLNDPDIDEEFFDWWTKYYDSLSHNHLESEMPANKGKHHKLDFDLALFGKKIHGLHFYPSELENCPDFDGFEDTIRSFLLTKQSTKAHSDTGKFKGCIGLYKTNTEKLMTIEGNPAEEGVFSGVARELGAVIPLTVRVYVIRAHQLYSREKFGTVNPFIEVAIPSSSQIISDSKHFIPQEKNPIFGKCYELDARLPFDSTVVVRVMDKMRLKEKELIGETAIDLENRYYSRHRGTCGLQREYASEGYNAWRDVHKPSEILTWLCLSYNLPLPEYNRGIVDQVVVGGHRFTCVRRSDKHIKESLALTALLNWQDVPIIGCKLLEEHVETRSLFLPHQQGIEKGKLEMWVDIFPGMMELPPPVDVKPRTPQKYELRAVVWSTRNVKLVDDGALVGKQNTDIFVKGWLKGKEDVQKTDVHYASLTGEGIFNWRFVFNFSFDRHEQMIVSDDFSNKIPPILYLQAWDQERISSNEYIGSLSLDLRDLPPPSKRLPLTKVYMPIKKWKRNLFKDRYARGWWPFIGQDRGRLKTVGMVDLELFLLTDLEAERSPAGRGRNEPDALPEPLRPIVKYTVWIVPFRAIKNYLWRYHKGAIFKLLIGIIMGIFIMVLVYAIPNYSVKKAMNA